MVKYTVYTRTRKHVSTRIRDLLVYLSKNNRQSSSENPTVVFSYSITVRLMAACMA